MSSWDWANGQGSTPPTEIPIAPPNDFDRDRRVVADLVLAASGGSSLPVGSHCSVDFAVGGITISSVGYNATELVPYAQVIALEVGGGTTRTGGHFIGGGFGIEGAVGGMLAASVLNSLTTRTHINTVLRVATASAEYIFLSHTVDAAKLRLLLTPVQPRIRQAQVPPNLGTPSATTPSIADELRKLAALRDEGILNESEFAAAKARLLSAS